MTLKLGDRVRVLTSYTGRKGEVGTVELFDETIHVRFADGDVCEYRSPSSLELVQPEGLAPQYTKGDRVEVCLNGEVTYVSPSGVYVVVDGRHEVALGNADITKLEKPVVTFKPGDYVRSKRIPEYTYLILEDGYVELEKNLHQSREAIFTSEGYEKFSLHEAPL